MLLRVHIMQGRGLGAAADSATALWQARAWIVVSDPHGQLVQASGHAWQHLPLQSRLQQRVPVPHELVNGTA